LFGGLFSCGRILLTMRKGDDQFRILEAIGDLSGAILQAQSILHSMNNLAITPGTPISTQFLRDFIRTNMSIDPELRERTRDDPVLALPILERLSERELRLICIQIDSGRAFIGPQ